MKITTKTAGHDASRDAGRPAAGRSGTARRRRRHEAGFWLVAYAFAVTMAFSAAPAPLYVLYQRRDGFGSLVTTLVFAAYAVGVVVSLFLAGHISDWAGRRRVLVVAVLVNTASGVMFVTWPSVPGLLVARFVSGLSIGMLTATATAHLTELHRAARPGAPRTRADLVATAANLGGLGLGPLIAGLLAQYAPDPLRLPYLVFDGLMLLGALAVAAVAPETVERLEPRPAYHPQRVSVPKAARPAYFAAAAGGIVVFAVFGLFTSLAPNFLAGTMHDRSHALAGFAAFLVFGVSAAGQAALARTGPARQVRTGFAALAAGLVMVTVAVWMPDLALFLAGGAVAGGGAGVMFKGSVALVLTIAPAETRGEALAGFFLAAYAGLAFPVIGLGVATRYLSARSALLGFSAVLLAVLIVAARRLLRSSAEHAEKPV